MRASGNASRTVAEDLQLLCLPVEGADGLVKALARALHARELGLNLLGQLGPLVKMRLEDVDFGARLLLGSMSTGGGGNHGTAVCDSSACRSTNASEGESEDLPDCGDGIRGKGMAKPSTRQFQDDMGRRSTGWVEMESAPKGYGPETTQLGWQAR